MPTYSGRLHEHFLHWTSDGSHLVFNSDDTIWTLDIEGAVLREIVDIDVDYESQRGEGNGYRFRYGFHADVSPDGSRIVYSTCEYILPGEVRGRYSEGYEIAVVNIDGTGKRRLTSSDHFNNYPVWSPDGKQIAYIVNLGRDDFNDHYPRFQEDRHTVRIAVMSGDGYEKGPLSSFYVALYPPVWSPDGQSIAYLEDEGEQSSERVVYTTTVSDSVRKSIGETTALPAWSPDTGELTVASLDGEDAIIYAVMPNGAGLRHIWRGKSADGHYPVSHISWSPDGTELLFASDNWYVVDSDGDRLRALFDDSEVYKGANGAAAVWSPDGSRIALYNIYGGLVTVSRDGADLRVLVEADRNEGPRLAQSTQPEATTAPVPNPTATAPPPG